MDEKSREIGFLLMNELREKKFKVEYNRVEKNIKKQIRDAIRLNAKFLLIIGEEEIRSNRVKIKDLIKKEEKEVELDKIDKFLFEKRN